MTMEVKYNYLLKEFLSLAEAQIDQILLEILKQYYAESISSSRRLSYIRNTGALLETLEKRDILNPRNVEPLLYISQNFLNNLYIESKIKEYQVYLEGVEHVQYNMYLNKNSTEDNSESESATSINDHVLEECMHNNENQLTSERYTKNYRTNSEQEETLKQMVLSRISERIGRSWRDTVRFLGIQEYQIDIIQNKHPFDLKEQSNEALKLYMSQCYNDSWKLNLIQALEKARRKDLRELVEELIIHARMK